MKKICTDLEQSKKLLELGIDVYTADMFWKNGVSDKYIQCFTPFVSCGTNIDYDYDVPAWSLETLMKFLPSEFTEVGKYSTTTYKIDIRKYKFTDDVDLYQIAYGSIKFDVDGQYSFKYMINTGEKENLIDAAFQMVCWLKENGKI